MSDQVVPSNSLNILIIVTTPEGGGARGLSSLLILDQIMDRLQHVLKLHQPPSVQSQFEVVAGTGTGAVTACLVGRLGVPVKKAIEYYVRLVEVFSDRRRIGTTTYKITTLQSVLKKIVNDITGNENTRMMETEGGTGSCRTMVFAMSKYHINAATPRIFRSYQAVANQMPDCTIWEAVSASMAHPEMFKAVEIGEGYMREAFVDGGLGCNNPTAHVLAEVKALFPGRHVSTVLCIGSGHPNTIQIPDRNLFARLVPTNVLAATKQIAADAESVAQDMEVRFRSATGVYFRFSVDQGMQHIGLSEWERLKEVVAHTRPYTQLTETNARMDRAVIAVHKRKPALTTEQIDGELRPTKVVTEPTGVKACPAPTPLFTGRQDTVDRIIACIRHGDKQRCIFVLHGLGGSGKTQLALKAVEDTWDMWSDLFFVDATSHETLVGALESFAKSRQIGQTYQDTLCWLANRRERWLMVYDNVDDPSIQINKFLPDGNRGSILITTRMPSMAMLARGVDSDSGISAMCLSEGLELLTKTIGRRGPLEEDENYEVLELLERIGYLALAIVQAGAYIRASQISVRQYLDMFIRQQKETLERYTALPVKVDSYERSVYTTWYMSYERLKTNARKLLQLMAFMHHTGIVEDIFRRAALNLGSYSPSFPMAAAEEEALADVSRSLQPFLSSTGTWNSNEFLSTMTELLSYSLASFNRADRSYMLHVLVHNWVGTMAECAHNIGVERTMLLLGVSVDFEETSESLLYKRIVEVHVTKALEREPRPNANNAARFSAVYFDTGKWSQMERMEQIVVDNGRRTLGEQHHATLTGLNNLALSYRQQARYTKAVALQEKVYDITKQVWGVENHATLINMANLAYTYQDLGRFAEAESLQLDLVSIRKRVYGHEHDNTLLSMRDLAVTYRSQGRSQEAEVLQRCVLETQKRLLGVEHPYTLSSKESLALTYCAQYRYEEAQALQLQVLESKKRVYGEEHPETFASMFHLGSTFRYQSLHEKSEELLVRALNGRKRVLGVTHPHTWRCMCELLITYQEMGRARLTEYQELRGQIERLKNS